MKNMTYEEIQDILDDYHDSYTTVVPRIITGQGRWYTHYEQVIQSKVDGTYWKVFWSGPSTECQECDFEPIAIEVKPVQVTVTKFIAKE